MKNEHLLISVKAAEVKAAWTLASRYQAAKRDGKQRGAIILRASLLWAETTEPQVRTILERAFAIEPRESA